MTPAEFKAWFEGFIEAIDGSPNEKQFERIKEQVKKLQPAKLAAPIIGGHVDDDWRRRWPEERDKQPLGVIRPYYVAMFEDKNACKPVDPLTPHMSGSRPS